jgi:3D (Asp-Asp-Asp) domain-containing protein
MRRWLLCAFAAAVVPVAVLASPGSRPRPRPPVRPPIVLARGARVFVMAGRVALATGKGGSAARGASSAAGVAVHPARPKGFASRCSAPPPEPSHPISHPEWLSGVAITEYYPAPERWFNGRKVTAPGLSGRHPVDWLYSARGLAMEGDGITVSGRPAHIEDLAATYWVNAAGRQTRPVCLGQWSEGSPVWLRGGWRNRFGEVTYPLAGGGWSNGRGGRPLDYGGVTFAPGASLPVRYYHSIAVDPKLIPEGSRVYVPAYRPINGGWFVAQDTGGAIKGRHIDVYRPPPASPSDLGRYMTHQRIYVLPPR